MKKQVITFLTLLAINLGLSAQEEAAYKLFAKYTGTQVQLKVAPQKAADWLNGARYGYDFYAKKAGQATFVRLNDQPVKPQTTAEILGSDLDIKDSLADFQQQSVWNQVNFDISGLSGWELVNYQQELQNNYGFYFLLTTRFREISAVSGMEFVDFSVRPGEVVEYQLRLAKAENAQPVAQQFVIAEPDQMMLPELAGSEEDHAIQLAWSPADEGYVIAYYVEKAADSAHFERITEAPAYVNAASRVLYLTDSLPQNYVPYQYRLVGLDIWGEETTPGPMVSFQGIDRQAPALPDSVWVTALADEKALQVNWSYQSRPEDLAQIMIQQADSANGLRKVVSGSLLSSDQNRIVSRGVTPGENTYFWLTVADTAGNFETSRMITAVLPDIYPPAKPSGLSAEIDSTGVVRLSWAQNPENDLLGYAVYRSNGPKLRQIKISDYPVGDTLFVDTLSLNRLNKESYYTIMAHDRHYNYSDYAEAVMVSVRDTLPPAFPVFTDIKQEGSSLHFSFVPSVSADVKEQRILQMSDGQVYATIAELLPGDSVYWMEMDQSGYVNFALQAIDQDGNASEISPVRSVLMASPVSVATIKGFKAKQTKDGVLLSWETESTHSGQFRIYRRTHDSKARLLAEVGVAGYTDQTIPAATLLTYYIVMTDQEGNPVLTSNQVELKTKK